MADEQNGLWAAALDGLVGRDDDIRTLRGLLFDGPRAAVVVGIAGSGKTSVLDVAARATAADGAVVMRATALEGERDLPYAALTGLFAAVGVDPADLLDTLATDPLRLRLALLAEVERLSEHRPLLIVVDDVHWVDDSSRAVLAFLARRLTGTRVSLLAAARGDVPPAELSGLPTLTLEPLGPREAEQVVLRTGADLNGMQRDSVVRRAGGNPLALVELARTAAASRGAWQGEEEMRLSAGVEAVFAADLAGLPDDTRRLLLLAAAGGDDLATLQRAAGAASLEALLTDLVPAERQGVIRVDRRVTFRHPLVLSAVYSTATALDRLAAHRVLAEADDDPDRRVWHEAAAAIEPDEALAQRLMEAGERAIRRGANAEASRAITRAADLSPDDRDRERRLLVALDTMSDAGHLDWLLEVAADLRSWSRDAAVRAEAGHFAAFALAQTERQMTAQRTLVDVLEELVGLDPGRAWLSLTTLATLAYRTGDDTGLVAAWLTRVEAQGDLGPVGRLPLPITEAARAWVRSAASPLTPADDLLAQVRDRPASDPTWPPATVAQYEMVRGATAWILDESSIAVDRLQRAIDLMQRGNPGQLAQTLMALGQAHYDVGAFDEVDEVGRVLAELAEAAHLGYAKLEALALRGRVAAVRGDSERARALIGEVLVGVDVGETLGLEVQSRLDLGLAAFAENDPDVALDQMRAAFHADGTPVHGRISYASLGDLAGWAARTGRVEEVREIVAVARGRLAGAGPRWQAQLARAEAHLAGDDAEQLFVAATAPEAGRWPFEHAAARLDLGSWLRRRHRTGEARRELLAAYDAFQRLGARPFADLARAELRAAGVSAAPQVSAWDDLTAQERQVVRLAAQGRTNKEIAGVLYLSPRTVGVHLYRAFPKLGVTSRAQLRDVTEQLDRG